MLLGLIDPSHDERADDEPGRMPRWFGLDEVLTRAARSGPEWSPWPYELLASAIDQYQERDYVSVSMLTGGCARGKVIERKDDYILSVDDLYPALRGTQIHRTLEGSPRENSVAEWRFWTTIRVPGFPDPVELSCSPDIVTWEPNALGDYKVTENPPDQYPWKSHTMQVNFNQWVVRHAERWADSSGDTSADIPFQPRTWVPEQLYLVYLGPKGPKVLETKKTMEVPSPKTGKLVKRRMPYVWDDEEVTDRLFPKMKAMLEALAAYPEWPFGNKFAGDDPKDDYATGFEGPPGWECPGYPWCSLPRCMAKRYPNGLRWESS